MNQRAHYEMLLESQYWPGQRLVDWQRRQLVDLLIGARTHSPFYRFRLNAVFSASGGINWDRWHDIPILSRAEVTAHHAKILSANPPAAHGPFKDMMTSGSTGDPVVVRTTTYLVQLATAAIWRASLWHGVDWSKTYLNQLYVDTPLTAITKLPGPWGPPWLRSAQRGRQHVSPRPFSAHELFEGMVSTKADYVTVAAGLIVELARISDAAGRPIRVKGFFARGGTVEPYERDYVREVFGADIIGLYSSKESGSLAHPCPEGLGLHVNDEQVLVEIVDDEGRPVAPGEEGRVVVTPFGSTAFPLIRYDQGDRAVRGAPCACGRSLSVIERISGRTIDLFRHPDGRVRFGQGQVAHLRTIIGAKRWQVAQIGPTAYEVRLPQGINYDLTRLEEFRQAMAQGLFGDADVTIRFVDALVATAAGKFREYVRELPPVGL